MQALPFVMDTLPLHNLGGEFSVTLFFFKLIIVCLRYVYIPFSEGVLICALVEHLAMNYLINSVFCREFCATF